ncbi:hypothetical protein TNCV_4336221 [Trichonephila clavipes]|nr:hypothetical protein TNCV_4336221 [Trichonephila clavipes]
MDTFRNHTKAASAVFYNFVSLSDDEANPSLLDFTPPQREDFMCIGPAARGVLEKIRVIGCGEPSCQHAIMQQICHTFIWSHGSLVIVVSNSRLACRASQHPTFRKGTAEPLVGMVWKSEERGPAQVSSSSFHRGSK